MIRPHNNHCLVEVIDQYAGVARDNAEELMQKGKLVAYDVSPDHMTNGAGYTITMPRAEIRSWLEELVGQTVMWGQYADSGQVFEIGDIKYALIPWWRIIGDDNE